MKLDVRYQEPFAARHHGVADSRREEMLATVGAPSLDALMDETVPAAIRLPRPLQLPAPVSEAVFLKQFKQMMQQNQLFRSYIGMGYYGTVTPPVILRNILENPGWYTAYTPYQAEIAQGRLEMLMNFQTLVSDLTGLEIATASLLDEGTAAAEAMTMFYGARPRTRKSADVFFVSDLCHPQTIDVLRTRALPVGIELRVGDHRTLDVTDENLFGVLLQYPGTDGVVEDYSALIAAAREQGAQVAVATDLLSLTLLTPPGEMGADAAVGSAQRFGVPMGYGGPHAAFFATRDGYKRRLPGRIIGLSKDAQGNPAYRMALQTREQHIRREKATSNICTAQVLLAVMAAAYGVYHGPNGLRRIAGRVHGLTRLLAQGLETLGVKVVHTDYFDTLRLDIAGDAQASLRTVAEKHRVNLRFETDFVGVSLDETADLNEVTQLLHIFAEATDRALTFDPQAAADNLEIKLPTALVRQSEFMTHPVFERFHTEHDMLRYLKRLENRDLSLTHSMIALGSCTMKLNATTEMIPVTWPELGGLHPFVPVAQAAGYAQLFENLAAWLTEVTGFAGVSLQPNSGAQGEYTGLMVIRAYHQSRGDHHRDVALIPTSAHGTNPASAVMAGMEVVLVKCDARGNIDFDDIKAKAEQYSDRLSSLMITYPSTHGVFEAQIREICDLIHQHGGKVYMDGANMNAQVGLTSPGYIGADVCHLNLHKTFCIPHGGGGPGMGPIGVVADLLPFLPGHVLVPTGGEQAISAVSAAPFGSASILAISYAYIAMMGGEGLTRATELAILNANYIKARLEAHYPVLYTGQNGRTAHEFIVDLRGFEKVGVMAEDIAKRLMDYGFHAPTLSFPVAGTVMIEPTESESKEELDRFCDAMIAIRQEIREIEEGRVAAEDSILHHAPHTAAVVMAADWQRSYSREQAAYPLPWVKATKFWPTVSRIDSAYGDRNLVCSCPPLSDYVTAEEAPAASEVSA